MQAEAEIWGVQPRKLQHAEAAFEKAAEAAEAAGAVFHVAKAEVEAASVAVGAAETTCKAYDSYSLINRKLDVLRFNLVMLQREDGVVLTNNLGCSAWTFASKQKVSYLESHI